MENLTTENQKPNDWLKQLISHSWEAELLISALLLYGLFQLPDFINQFALRNIPSGNSLRILFTQLVSAVNLLKIGYMLHIVTRGLWVAMVGLSQVFPDGINRQRLRYRGKFDSELAGKETSEYYVLKLEQLSSVTYGLSFLLFGMYLGVFNLLFLVVLINEWGLLSVLNNGHTSLGGFYLLFIIMILGLASLVYFDFLSGGLLKKDKSVAKWYFPIAVVFRVLTLSFFYRRSLLILQSNLPKWSNRLLPVFVTIIIVGYSYLNDKIKSRQSDIYFEQQGKSVQLSNYETYRNKDEEVHASIPSEIISQNAIPFFIRPFGLLNRLYKSLSPELSNTVRWDKVDAETRNVLINDVLRITIDDSVILRPKMWHYTKHPVTYRDGFQAYLDLSVLPYGEHTLRLQVDSVNVINRGIKNLDGYYMTLATIPFFYDKP